MILSTSPCERPQTEVPRRNVTSYPSSEVWLVVVLVLVAAAVYLSCFTNFEVGAYMDDAHYVVTARSLASGTGFNLTTLISAPPELRYPPGFPVLLAPFALLFPNSLDALRVPSLLFTLGAIPLWFAYVRRRVGFSLAYPVVSLFALNPLVVGQSTIVMSEAAFTFVLALFLLGAEQSQETETPSMWSTVGISALAVMLYFIRSAGVAVAAGSILYLLMRRRWTHAAIAAIIFAVPAGAWALRGETLSRAGQDSSYQEQFFNGSYNGGNLTSVFDLIHRVGHNAYSYATSGLLSALAIQLQGPHVTRVLGSFHFSWLPVTVGLTLTLLAGLGVVLRFRSGGSVAEYIVMLYVALLAVWPWVLPRFLHPILPLLYLYTLIGIVTVLKSLRFGGFRPSAAPKVAAMLVFAFMLLDIGGDFREIRNPVRDRITDLRPGAVWIAQNTPPSSVVMSSFPLERSLYTQRRMVDVPSVNQSSRQTELRYVRESGADYVLIGPPLKASRSLTLDTQVAELNGVLAQQPKQFNLVYLNDLENVRVYAVVKPN